MNVPSWAWWAAGGIAAWALLRDKSEPAKATFVPPPIEPVGASPAFMLRQAPANPKHVPGQQTIAPGWYWRGYGGEPTAFPLGWHGPFNTREQAVANARATL